MSLAYIILQIFFIIFTLFAIRYVSKRNKKLQEENKLSIQSGYYITAFLSIVFALFVWWVVMYHTQNKTVAHIIGFTILISGILYAKKTYTKGGYKKN